MSAKSLITCFAWIFLCCNSCASSKNEAELNGAWVLPNSLTHYGTAFLLDNGKAKLWTYSITRPNAPTGPREGSYRVSGDKVTLVMEGEAKPYVYYIRLLEGKTRLINEIYFKKHTTVDLIDEGDFLVLDTEFSESSPFAFQQRWHDERCKNAPKTSLFGGCR